MFPEIPNASLFPPILQQWVGPIWIMLVAVALYIAYRRVAKGEPRTPDQGMNSKLANFPEIYFGGMIAKMFEKLNMLDKMQSDLRDIKEMIDDLPQRRRR